MDPLFKQFVLAQDGDALTDYLDNTPIDAQILNMWFRQAARFPGNWSTERGEDGTRQITSDRNAWLQTFYEKYVSEETRQYPLTDRRRFQRCSSQDEMPPEVIVERVSSDLHKEKRGRLLKTYPRAERERIIKEFGIQPEDVDHVRFISTSTTETVFYTMCERSK